MSREDIELLWAAMERWNAGEEPDFKTIHPEVELKTALSAVRGESYRGHEGVRQWRRDIYEQFEEWRVEIDDIREVDKGRYLGLGRVHLRGKGSGVEFDQPLGWVFEMRDGMLCHMRVYVDQDEALEAVGLGE
jgi:ketosteroid isomerase-like protein